MTVLALDLRNINDTAFAAEVARRFEAGDLTFARLGIVPDAKDVSDELLIEEVNARIQRGNIDVEDLDIDMPETGGGTEEGDSDIDPAEIDEAAARFARREYGEALWCLEKALGRDFAGLGDLKIAGR